MLETELALIKSELGLDDEDFVHFFNQEKAYLDAFWQPSMQDHFRIRYVEVLDELNDCW